MTICQERVISRPQVGGRLDSMAPSGLFQLCDSVICADTYSLCILSVDGGGHRVRPLV